jgi:hypothetical protein
MNVLSIDNHVDVPLDYNDDEVVFGLSWFGICNVGRTLYFTCKDVVVNIAHPFD